MLKVAINNKLNSVEYNAGQVERVMMLLELFNKSDNRGQDLLIAIAKIHAQRYPSEQK